MEKVCPGCGTQWPYVVMAKAEVVEEEERDVQQPPPPCGPHMRKRQRSSRHVEEGERESNSQPPENGQPSRRQVAVKVDYDDNGFVPSQLPGTKRATRNSARLHR